MLGLCFYRVFAFTGKWPVRIRWQMVGSLAASSEVLIGGEPLLGPIKNDGILCAAKQNAVQGKWQQMFRYAVPHSLDVYLMMKARSLVGGHWSLNRMLLEMFDGSFHIFDQ